MFRDNETSNPTRLSGIPVPVKTLAPTDKLQDWEMGGVALNDPSQGLEYQLWKYTLVIDPETEHGQVFVQAPTVPVTMLFEGDFISEIAGCFDQNMNPMVAYQQSGDAKIWWWDPTVPGMVHTTLPAGCIDLRVTLDDKRQFNVADSDIILSYVRAGSLYFRLQRERYATEHLLKEGILRLVYSAMNTQWRLQWKALGSGEGFTDPMLGDIVYDICRRAGILPENIDVSELYNPETDFVPGLLVDTDDGLDVPLDQLMDVYGFFKVEKNRKICFLKKGRAVVANIPYNDLVDDFPKTLKRTERDKNKLPKVVNLTHIDPDGGFAKNKQSAGRRSNVFTGTSEKSLTTKVVLKADQASRAAWFKIKAEHGEAVDYEFSTRLKYTYLVPGDVIRVQDVDGAWYRMHITDRNEDDGTIKFTAEHDGGEAVYNGLHPAGRPLDPPVSTTPGQVGDTIFELLNLPVQRDEDDELGLYGAARGTKKGWSGYVLEYSIDDGVTYVPAYTSDRAANIGETVTSIADDGTTVDVLVPYPLESQTDAQLDAGFNRFVIGEEEMQFKTASLVEMVGEQYHYNLTGIRRAVLRTMNEAWPVGSRFVLLDDAVTFIRLQRELYGKDLRYRAVSVGQPSDEAEEVAYLFDFAFSQTEWAVGDVLISPNEEPGATGVVVTWTPAPRLGTFGAAPFESKYFLGYRLKFGDGFIVDVPKGTTSYAYADAYLAGTEVTVEVWSLNEITGECAWVGGTAAGGTPGEEPGGETPPPVTIGPYGAPASTTAGPNGGFVDDPTYPVPQPTVLGVNVITNPDFSSAGVGNWKKQNGSALDARWSNTGNKLRFEGSIGVGYEAAYNYGAKYSVPIWPFARYTFTVSGKVQCVTPGTKVALGVARGFSTAGSILTWSVDTVTDFAEYPSETTISKAYTHVIDAAGKTLGGRYVVGLFMPVLVIQSTTGETRVVTLDDVSMVITEYTPAMTAVVLDNVDFPAGETGWTRFPYVAGMSAELTFASGFCHFAPTNAYAIHSYLINNDKLNNHVSWAAGHRIRVRWKSWCNDPTAYGYVTTNGSAACIALSVSGAGVPTGGVPGWQAALVRGDYTEYEYWMELPGDSTTFDAYLGALMKCIVGKEVRFGDFEVHITNAPEP